MDSCPVKERMLTKYGLFMCSSDTIRSMSKALTLVLPTPKKDFLIPGVLAQEPVTGIDKQ